MAHYCLGIALHRMGHIERAVQALEVAISQNPNFAEAHKRLADIYRRRIGDLGKAEEHQQLAVEIREQNRLRRRDGRKAAIPEPVPVDFAAMLPKVPELQPAEPEKPPAAVNHVPRIGQAPVPPDRLPPAGDEFVTVVTGLPRSGTSMMMQMLHAAGLEPLTDELRQADEDNPRGYFELQAATQLRDNPDWVAQAQGKVIKVVAQLVPYLPQGFRYRMIFMQRDIDEILASQRKMLQRQGKQGSSLADNRMTNVFQRQLTQTRQLLNQHQIPTLSISHSTTIEAPAEVAAKVAEFLGSAADVQAIAAAVDPTLYRQRRDAARCEDSPDSVLPN